MAAAVAAVAPLRAQHHRQLQPAAKTTAGCNDSCRWMGTNAGSGSRGFGCGAGSSRRGIVGAAAKGVDGDGDGDGDENEDLEVGGEDVLAPAPSAAERAKLDKEAAAFAASWASQLSAAAWEEMRVDDETVSESVVLFLLSRARNVCFHPALTSDLDPTPASLFLKKSGGRVRVTLKFERRSPHALMIKSYVAPFTRLNTRTQ